ncbi:uncharacterized protein [Malus domestica]|uniref:uncharacterized protein isoform X3 n=1 Tax=Malus domestica TaxID=3750 RepID=UPI003976F7EA
MEEDESKIGKAATTEHLAAEGAVEVEDESEIDEAATTEHPQGTVEVEEEEQSQIDEARKTDYRKPMHNLWPSCPRRGKGPACAWLLTVK